MQYNKLEQFLSKPRLDRYLLNCANSRDRAKLLYISNLTVSQAFYPLMNLFETFLRNAINDSLISHFNDPRWIITQRTMFMNHASLSPKFKLRRNVDSAIQSFAMAGRISTPSGVMAEQSFGFWTSLFDPAHFRLIGAAPLSCFPNKPSSIGRLEISNSLRAIREFRNRIYHNETICFGNGGVNFTQAINIKNEIYTLLDWMDVDLKPYVIQFDKVDSEITKAMNLHNGIPKVKLSSKIKLAIKKLIYS